MPIESSKSEKDNTPRIDIRLLGKDAGPVNFRRIKGTNGCRNNATTIGADKEGWQMMERARLALEMYPENPGRAMQVLRGLFSEDPSGFVRASAPLLSERDTPGSQPLIELLAQSVGVVELLCDPDFLDKQPSIDLAQRIAAIDPGLDSKLVRLLPDRGVNHSDPANTLGAERILE